MGQEWRGEEDEGGGGKAEEGRGRVEEEGGEECVLGGVKMGYVMNIGGGLGVGEAELLLNCRYFGVAPTRKQWW